MKMIRIAIDGPGGAGKSSLAKSVAKRLSIIYVDTGALYRTIGLYMLKNGIACKDNASVISALKDINLELKYVGGEQVILLNGTNYGDEIRQPEVSMAASNVSAIPEVRAFLLETQRNIAKTNSVIMDGRDIGTVILPDAEVKIFLTASPEARAKRRYEELIAKGKTVKYEDVYNEMVERDNNDSTRACAPCVPAEDATILDNSLLTAEETVDEVVRMINEKDSCNA
jgi:cytidylate kinase